VEDKSVTLAEIFKGSVPYWMLMLVVMLIIWAFPEVATWLPSKML
jgi:TRAP-type mannitol/chloroaromatic compound transport system permease large subunit